MNCPNWPQPLSSLDKPKTVGSETLSTGLSEINSVESKSQTWWNQYLGSIFTRLDGNQRPKKESTYELTRQQRKELLSIRIPTKEDKLIWSIPLPEGSYPQDGLPIWEKLYLDRKLPMLKCPPNSLVFARQQIGKKLWKDTEGQEFILYDPHSYEVTFSYENVHDPHLTTYYEGKEIRGFLVRVGDANEDGWGLCSLKKFNQYRKYLRRVHLSLVHTEMKRKEALKDEIHKIKQYKQITEDTMNALEQKVMMEEVRASIIEALNQYRLNRINRILASIKEKEDRVRKLYKKREKDKESQRQRGLLLLAEQELKNKIAMEIKRRKKIATLRRWHDSEEKRERLLRKQADEKIIQKTEKVRLRWQNKITNLRKMLKKENDYIRLQTKIREENIKIRNAYNENFKQTEKDRFHEIRNKGLKKKALLQRKKADKRMENAIINAWISINTKDYDLETEIYRVKKSLNSTMAELLTAQMEGPDRFSIILMSRNRIQREQKIPIQVSFAIDAVLESVIEQWARIRLILILEAIISQVKEKGYETLSYIKSRYKNGQTENEALIKTTIISGKIYNPNYPKKNSHFTKDTTNPHESFNANHELFASDSEAQKTEKITNKMPAKVISNYVQFGEITTYVYPIEYEPVNKLKSILGRPKTPMPSPEELCEAGFLEEKLNDLLPTLNDDKIILKEKREFHKIFKNVAIQLFKKSTSTTKLALDPITSLHEINKLVSLGETERKSLVNSLCNLIMNANEKVIYKAKEFDRLAKIIAREVVKEILNPPELRKEEDDGVARTKIMFYVPKLKKLHKPR